MAESEQITFDEVRKRLGDELVLLRDAWAQYIYLFAEAPERVELLNACAPWYFAVTQRVLFREVLLGISRLTDPRSHGKHENLVLATLSQDPALNSRAEVREKLEALVRDAEAAAAPIRVHRSKYIAHLDHAVALKRAETLLPGIRQAQIDDVLGRMAVAYRYYGSQVFETDYSVELHALGGADALVRSLEGSERWAQMKAIRAERESPPDIEPAV